MPEQESKARQLHSQSLALREQGKFVDSLQLDQEVLDLYAKDKDSLGFSEILSMHAKTYLHEFSSTGFPAYLAIAKHVALAAVDVAKDSGDESETMLPYFNLGEVALEAGDLDMSVDAYRKAVKIMHTNPPKRHNRKSVLANFEIHLTTTEYLNGDKSALERAEAAISHLKESEDASTYEYDVWLSGAHMRIASMLKNDDLVRAKEHLAKAKEIIDANSDLTLRAGQWEKLSKDF